MSAQPVHKPRGDRRLLLRKLSEELLHNYYQGRVIVGIDGKDGAGKTRFADDFASVLKDAGREVFRASIDGFHRPSEQRYARGRDSAEGFFRDSYDYDLFRRVLIEPYRLGGSTGFVTESFDVVRDQPVVEPAWQTLSGDDAFLIVDGVFLHRPELAGLWHFSVWLHVEEKTRLKRLVERDGPRSVAERYVKGQELYLAEVDPVTRASVIIDNTKPDRPKRIFADSC